LGFTLFEIGRSAYSQIDLKTSARPVIEELMEQTRTSVFLGILNWGHVTILDIVEARGFNHTPVCRSGWQGLSGINGR
jgi:DNA-binding IclR family transcriptional regulator